jgi:hypothetical protein
MVWEYQISVNGGFSLVVFYERLVAGINLIPDMHRWTRARQGSSKGVIECFNYASALPF